MNLLACRVADIIFEEGGRFLVSEDEGGRDRVEDALADALRRQDIDPARATTDDFRLLYHQGWAGLLERLVPADARDRVEDRFKELVFS